MKHFICSRVKLLVAAVLFAGLFAFTGCKPEPAEEEMAGLVKLTANDPLIGNWESSYGEKYTITQTDYDNYSHYDSFNYNPDEWFLYYSTTDLYKAPIDETKGYIYGKFDDEDHIGYCAEKGQWYALYYQNLTENSVSFGQPYKAGGKAACNSAVEAAEEFTIDNGYYNLSSLSDCTK